MLIRFSGGSLHGVDRVLPRVSGEPEQIVEPTTTAGGAAFIDVYVRRRINGVPIVLPSGHACFDYACRRPMQVGA